MVLVFIVVALGVLSFWIMTREENKAETKPVRDWRTQELWEDYPTVNYDKIHTYCTVAFEDDGKTFYYRTRNPELQVGDLVYVPVGYKYEKKVGRIVKMKKYRGYLAPYPLERTKHIIGKAEQEEGK